MPLRTCCGKSILRNIGFWRRSVFLPKEHLLSTISPLPAYVEILAFWACCTNACVAKRIQSFKICFLFMLTFLGHSDRVSITSNYTGIYWMCTFNMPCAPDPYLGWCTCKIDFHKMWLIRSPFQLFSAVSQSWQGKPARQTTLHGRICSRAVCKFCR